jgi:hypothetical protein
LSKHLREATGCFRVSDRKNYRQNQRQAAAVSIKTVSYTPNFKGRDRSDLVSVFTKEPTKS